MEHHPQVLVDGCLDRRVPAGPCPRRVTSTCVRSFPAARTSDCASKVRRTSPFGRGGRRCSLSWSTTPP